MQWADESCPDKPVETTLRLLRPDGSVAATGKSAPDGTFRQFTEPLPKTGENQITITAQNRRGDTNTIHKAIIIE